MGPAGRRSLPGCGPPGGTGTRAKGRGTGAPGAGSRPVGPRGQQVPCAWRAGQLCASDHREPPGASANPSSSRLDGTPSPARLCSSFSFPEVPLMGGVWNTSLCAATAGSVPAVCPHNGDVTWKHQESRKGFCPHPQGSRGPPPPTPVQSGAVPGRVRGPPPVHPRIPPEPASPALGGGPCRLTGPHSGPLCLPALPAASGPGDSTHLPPAQREATPCQQGLSKGRWPHPAGGSLRGRGQVGDCYSFIGCQSLWRSLSCRGAQAGVHTLAGLLLDKSACTVSINHREPGGVARASAEPPARALAALPSFQATQRGPVRSRLWEWLGSFEVHL